MKFITILILLLSAIASSGQSKVLKWSDEFCDYQGTYNAAKYSGEQLKNTLRMKTPGEFSITADATAFELADIGKLSVARLEMEYQTKRAVLRQLDIVKTAYWQSFRERKLEEMRQVYELSLVSIRAYKNATSLNDLKWAESCKVKYARPIIAGGDDLLNIWLMVNQDSRSKNSDPERLRRKFDQRNVSPDRLKYALVEVMTFGWWNCANADIKYIEYDGTPEKEFRKLFSRSKQLRCDGP